MRGAKTPKAKTWRSRQRFGSALVFERNRLRVLSALSDMSLPGKHSSVMGPTWLVSASYRGRRCTDRQMALVRTAFDMAGAEEDNHYPGISRGLFLVVNPADRRDCDCKTTEDVITEDDGFSWTNPTTESGEACRGCEHAALYGKPCPIHVLR